MSMKKKLHNLMKLSINFIPNSPCHLKEKKKKTIQKGSLTPSAPWRVEEKSIR